MRRNPAPARLTDSAPLVALSRSPPRGGKWTFDKIQGECCHNLLTTLDRRSDLTDRPALRVHLCFRSQSGVLWNHRVLIYLRHLLHGPTGRPYFFPVPFPSSRRNPIARGPVWTHYRCSNELPFGLTNSISRNPQSRGNWNAIRHFES